MFKVNYFQNTRNFYEKLQLDEKGLHIAQSASFSEFLRDKGSSAHVFGYKTFFEMLFPEWNHPHTELYLRSLVRDYIVKNVKEEEQTYYNKRVQDFYLSIRYVVEFGGLPLHHFPELSKEQTLLVSMYKELSKNPIITNYFYERTTLNQAKVNKRLNLANGIETIYFHHFDYLDGIRTMLMQLLKQIGYEVVCYIPYQPEKTNLYKNWLSIYTYLSGSTHEQWNCVEDSIPQGGTKFAHYLDKNVEVADVDRADLTFLHFDHPTNFKEFLKVSPIKKNIHEVITVFEENLNIYTDHTVRSHFYATTYGKFFLALQNCKKTGDGIIFTYDDFVNMMISGWVQSGGINGSKALTLLIDLRDYMEGASTFDEVLDRLQDLLTLQEFSGAFDALGKEQADRNSLKLYLSNPWRAFPYVHSSRYDITIRQLIECTKDLLRKANRLLLGEQEKQNVQAYLLELQRIFSSLRDNWEEEISKKFEVLFKADIPLTWEFGKEELFQLLTLYLASEEEEIEKIKNFDQLIGKTFIAEHIHVTGLSLKTFPWKSPSLPALLSHTWLKKCIHKSFISNNRDVRLQALLVDFYSRKVARNTAVYALYHLLAYSTGKITFSYIDELQVNDGPSIYFTIFEELYQSNSELIVQSEVKDWKWDLPVSMKKEEIPIELLESIPDLFWLDHDFCHKKFFLNSFVERHPIYEKDFHQQIVFASVGKLLSEQGEGEESLKEVVFPLFPQWTNAHKQNLLDTTFSKGLRRYKSYENIYYPRAMKRLQSLYSRNEVTNNWKAKYRYDHESSKIDDLIKEFKESVSDKKVKAKAGTHCRMCPFLHVCEEGEYVIDASDY